MPRTLSHAGELDDGALISILQAELQQDGGQSDGAHHDHGQRTEERAAIGEQHDYGQGTAEQPGGNHRPAARARIEHV